MRFVIAIFIGKTRFRDSERTAWLDLLSREHVVLYFLSSYFDATSR